MDILHTDSRRTVLVTLDEHADASNLFHHLSADYDVIRANSADESLDVMRARSAELSVVIIDIEMAKADNLAFLRTVSQEPLFDTIPVVVAARRPLTEDDMRCLEAGALDVMQPPYLRELTMRRIENAIRVKRSAAFYEIESMLRELPSNIFLKDAQGRYVFATHYWHHLDTGGDPNWTIRGKTDLEIRKDRENALKAMEADQEIIRSGKGTSYVIEINADGVQEFMELIKRPVFDQDGNVIGIIALINDVTEAELLKRELEKRAHTDELTGLRNHRAFDECIQGLSQRDDFPIAVITADCDDLKFVNDTYGHLVGDEYIRMASTVLKASLGEGADIFRTGGDEFVAFVPHTTSELADELVAAMSDQCARYKLQERDVSVSFGAAILNGPDEDPLKVIALADQAMYANKASRKRARGQRR